MKLYLLAVALTLVALSYAQDATTAAADGSSTTASSATEAGGSTASSATEAGGSTASSATEAGGSTASSATEAGGSTASSATEAGGSTASSATEAGSSTASSATEAGSSTASSATEAGSSTASSATEASTTPASDAGKDPNKTCQELYQNKNLNVTGEKDKNEPCEIHCYVQNQRGRVKDRTKNEQDLTKCGDKKVCVSGKCTSNDTPASKACQAKYPDESVHGEPYGKCQARCQRSGARGKTTVDQEDGTACQKPGRNTGTCKKGRCV